VDILGPFEVISRPLTLRLADTKVPASGSAARSPVAWWKLDETGGAEAADSPANRHPARVQGPAHWAPTAGRIGGAIELDGTGAYLDCGDASEFDLGAGFAVSCWVKARDWQQKMQTLIAKGDDTWRLHSQGTSGTVVFALNGPQPNGKDKNKQPRVTSKAALDSDAWQHIVGVYDGKRIALYVNGELQEAVSASGPLAQNTEPVWLGNNSAAQTQFFSGWLDDVRLYDQRLSESEIKALYRGDPQAATR
jgi:hypothetical protein